MKKIIITIAAVLFACTAAASPFYRCQVDGRTVISNIPCQQGDLLNTREIQTTPQSQPRQQSVPRTEYGVTPKASIPQRAQSQPAADYEINHRASERNGVVEVSGRISGPQCQSLRVDARARTSDGGLVSCVTVTRLSGNSTTFSCTESARRARDGRNREWFVSQISARCQNL